MSAGSWSGKTAAANCGCMREVRKALDRLVKRSELRTQYPRLYAALVASDGNRDRPEKAVQEPVKA